jgi:hypothetical protein
MQTIQLILEGCAVLLGFYIAFGKSYITEKGKNLATKQDIGKITSIVEETKRQFTADTEVLKSNLNSFSQNFHSIKTLERDAIIEINRKYSEWFNSFKTFSLAYYSYDNYEKLKELDFIFKDKLAAFEVAVDNLHLYMHDKELRDTITPLSNLTFELQVSILMYATRFMTHCKIYNNNRADISLGNIEEQNKRYHEIQQPVIDGCTEMTVAMHEKISPHHINFIKILNHRMFDLIQGTN